MSTFNFIPQCLEHNKLNKCLLQLLDGGKGQVFLEPSLP